MQSLSPLDGRYSKRLVDLRNVGFTEGKYLYLKYQIELEWMKCIARHILPSSLEETTLEIVNQLQTLQEDYVTELIGKHEAKLNHDTKAVEACIRELIEMELEDSDDDDVAVICNLCHFGLTSEDVSGLAYSLHTVRAMREVISPLLTKIEAELRSSVISYSHVPMLGLTHGQAASPTTFGKEMAVFLVRLSRQSVETHKSSSIPIKWGGAVGTMAAAYSAKPDVNWEEVSGEFLNAFGETSFHLDRLTTQIPDRGWLVSLLHVNIRIMYILLDFCRDMWLYTSRGLLRLKILKDEVGSSTMPHKVNPIHFENAEGNLELGIRFSEALIPKLMVSRLQRDLSDSTCMRNLGVCFGHMILALQSVHSGLERVSLDIEAAEAELADHWELLAEPIQSVLRKYGCVKDPYERLKMLTRVNKKIDASDIRGIIDEYKSVLDSEDYERLSSLTPLTYLGTAPNCLESLDSHV